MQDAYQKWPERMSFRTRKDGVMTGRPRERGGANSAKLREAERRHHSHSESKKDCYIDPETFEFELDASTVAAMPCPPHFMYFSLPC